MDYLAWELARQRAALWALLGGGEPEEEGEELPSREDPSARGRESFGDGTRRSPAPLERAEGRGAGRDGRYAAGREQAGVPPVGGPGAWETAREAAGGRLDSASGGPEAPVSAWEQVSGEETGASARGGGDAGTGPASRQRAPEEARRTALFGTGGAAEPPSGGRNALETAPEAAWETAASGAESRAESGLEARLAAEAAGGRGAGRGFDAGRLTLEAGSSSGRRTGGGETAGDSFAVTGRGGTGTARPGGGGTAETAEQGGRRALPWGGGWESAALRAEAEARSLSRAVQRDARRYDGGFTIY